MLGVFSGEVVEAPAELVMVGSRMPMPKTTAVEMPMPKTTAMELVNRFTSRSAPAVSVQIGTLGSLAYSQSNESTFRPSDGCRSFAAKDGVYCVFEGVLNNLGSLRLHYGLSKSANEAILLIEAYKALRDRAPHPPRLMLRLLDGTFAFVLFDGNTSTLLVAHDGNIPLFWGITSDGYVAFADDLELLKGSCGKSLATFPQGCFYSNNLGGRKSYKNSKHKVTLILTNEEGICGATFKVDGSAVLTATH